MLVFGFCEKAKKGEKESVTKFVGIVVYDYFYINMSLKFIVKHLLHIVFSLIT